METQSHQYIATFTDTNGEVQRVPFTSKRKIGYVLADPYTVWVNPAYSVEDLDMLRKHAPSDSTIEVSEETGELTLKLRYTRMRYAAVTLA